MLVVDATYNFNKPLYCCIAENFKWLTDARGKTDRCCRWTFLYRSARLYSMAGVRMDEISARMRFGLSHPIDTPGSLISRHWSTIFVFSCIALHLCRREWRIYGEMVNTSELCHGPPLTKMIYSFMLPSLETTGSGIIILSAPSASQTRVWLTIGDGGRALGTEGRWRLREPKKWGLPLSSSNMIREKSMTFRFAFSPHSGWLGACTLFFNLWVW